MKELEPALRHFRDRIFDAAAKKQTLCIRGGGTKDWYGQVVRGEPLDTREWRGIIAYEPTELVITARCGTPLAEIEAALAERRQMLAFEPPHFGAQATIGGVVAAGISGPRRQTAGAVRDFILGVGLMDGRAQMLYFGGQVMKNVAGYDISRVLAGSLGTLGLITQVSLKVLPHPVTETSLVLEMNQGLALRRLNEWGGQPLPISATAWHDGRLAVRLSGALAAVGAARRKLGGQDLPGASAYWKSLREQTHPFFTSGAGQDLWRLSVPTATPPLELQAAQLIEWGGAQRWLRAGEDAAESIRAAATLARGHATLFRGGKANEVFHPLTASAAAIHRRLKQTFDPSGIFNLGRMYRDL